MGSTGAENLEELPKREGELAFAGVAESRGDGDDPERSFGDDAKGYVLAGEGGGRQGRRICPIS